MTLGFIYLLSKRLRFMHRVQIFSSVVAKFVDDFTKAVLSIALTLM